MKKLLILSCLLFMAMGVWAGDYFQYTNVTSTGITNVSFPDKMYEITIVRRSTNTCHVDWINHNAVDNDTTTFKVSGAAGSMVQDVDTNRMSINVSNDGAGAPDIQIQAHGTTSIRIRD